MSYFVTTAGGLVLLVYVRTLSVAMGDHTATRYSASCLGFSDGKISLTVAEAIAELAACYRRDVINFAPINR